jgi:crotonobetainyl-CoA:carnitine CoA-transferase CaiB-like acyl-CoA transferase
LEGIRVLDIATLFAGPLIATMLGDFGADVTKVEHPENGDWMRNLGKKKDGVPLFWKQVSRNKRCITLNLSKKEAKEILFNLVKDVDILIENFRPGTLEKWGIGWEVLSKLNPKLIMVRVTGFGQDGPYKDRPGFGTLAESMSGFAHITGQEGGPPTLPPFGLADGIAAINGAFAAMVALEHRRKYGKGQYIDLAIYEPLFSILGPQVIEYDQLEHIQNRKGNRSHHNAPRNCYSTSDGKWVAISTSAESIARRVFQAVEREELFEDPKFSTSHARVKNVDEVDEIVGGWISRHTRDEVIARFEEYQCAIAPIYDITDIFNDPHFQYRNNIVQLEDEELGQIRMQNVTPKFSESKGAIRWSGPEKGRHNDEVYGSLGLSVEELNSLRHKGVI